MQYSVCSDDFINFSFDNTEDYSTAAAQTAKVGTSCSDAFVAAQNYVDYISILGKFLCNDRGISSTVLILSTFSRIW